MTLIRLVLTDGAAFVAALDQYMYSIVFMNVNGLNRWSIIVSIMLLEAIHAYVADYRWSALCCIVLLSVSVARCMSMIAID